MMRPCGWQVAKLERHQSPFPHQRGAKAGPKSQKEHASATFVTAKCLHGGVVNQAYRYAERFGEIKTNSPFTQMLWIPYNASFADGRWETDGRHIEFPATRGLF